MKKEPLFIIPIGYRSDSKGNIRFDVWDGVNGGKEGNQIKRAISIGIDLLGE
jgi:hypothetical protein